MKNLDEQLALTAKSFAPQVIADSSGKWRGNALRFKTRTEAEKNVRDLASRWYLVRDTRVIESEDEPNYSWDDENRLIPIAKTADIACK